MVSPRLATFSRPSPSRSAACWSSNPPGRSNSTPRGWEECSKQKEVGAQGLAPLPIHPEFVRHAIYEVSRSLATGRPFTVWHLFKAFPIPPTAAPSGFLSKVAKDQQSKVIRLG